MGVENLFDDCELSVGEFSTDGLEGQGVVLVSKRKDGANNRIYYSLVLSVHLYYAPEGFDNC